MSLDSIRDEKIAAAARRAAGEPDAAAATAATTATTATATASPRKKDKETGPLRTVTLGRKYQDFEAKLDEEGNPLSRAYFDRSGVSYESILEDEDTSLDRVVSNSTMRDHLNETVFKTVFGRRLRAEVLRLILDGISDQYLRLIERGYKVKMPNLATFTQVTRKERKARNPKTGAPVSVKSKTAMTARPTRSAAAYIRKSGGRNVRATSA